MTEKIKSAIEEIENMRKFNYTLAPNEVFDLAIRSLQAWEEVLQELEMLADARNDDNDLDYASGLEKAIDIINQHLAEIEEEE